MSEIDSGDKKPCARRSIHADDGRGRRALVQAEAARRRFTLACRLRLAVGLGLGYLHLPVQSRLDLRPNIWSRLPGTALGAAVVDQIILDRYTGQRLACFDDVDVLD